MDIKFGVSIGLMVCLSPPLLADAIEISSEQHRLEFHGYYRGGVGASVQGRTGI